MTETDTPEAAPEGARGKLLLVGFGPGAHEHLTYRARAAIAEAEVVIGYTTYIKLIADLLEGKEVHKKGMSEELDRVHLAYDMAMAGRKVALISSGDICVYGMAGPALEVLTERGWTGQDDPHVEVEVVPRDQRGECHREPRWRPTDPRLLHDFVVRFADPLAGH